MTSMPKIYSYCALCTVVEIFYHQNKIKQYIVVCRQANGLVYDIQNIRHRIPTILVNLEIIHSFHRDARNWIATIQILLFFAGYFQIRRDPTSSVLEMHGNPLHNKDSERHSSFDKHVVMFRIFTSESRKKKEISFTPLSDILASSIKIAEL